MSAFGSPYFGEYEATTGTLSLSPSSIASGESWGTPTVTPGPVALSPSSIGSAEAWGNPTVSTRYTISPSSIASAESFGTALIVTGTVTIHPSSIGSGESWGTPALGGSLAPSSISTGEAWGTPVVTPGAITVHPSSIASREAWGTLSVTQSNVPIRPPSIHSGESWGTPQVGGGIVIPEPVTPGKQDISVSLATLRSAKKDTPEKAVLVKNPAADLDVNTLKMRGGKKAELSGVLVEVSLTRTIDGASSIVLTCDDYDRNILLSNQFPVGAQLRINNLNFALVGFAKKGEQVELTFEDAAVYALRRRKGFKRAYRDQMTRAQFIEALVREVRPRIPFYCPQLHDPQAVKPTHMTKDERQTLRKPGVASRSKGLKVHNGPATPTQLRNAQKILDTGVQLKCSYKELLGSIVAAINETALKNTQHGDAAGPDSIGIFQQRAGWGPLSQRRTIEGASGLFFAMIKKKNRQFPHVNVAQLVALTQFQGASSVTQSPIPLVTSWEQRWVGEAEKILSAFGVTPAGFTGESLTIDNEPLVANNRYPFTRGKNEDSWTAIQRLAGEVHWRAFMHDGVLYYISDKELMASQPAANVTENDAGIDNIDFQADTGRKASTATVTCHASRWNAPPGTVIDLTDMGPHGGGRWLVNTIQRDSLYASLTEITLGRLVPALKEPAADAETVSSDIGDIGDVLANIDFKGKKIPKGVVRAYKKAVSIASHHYSYVFAGGHSNFDGPYDCSGAVSAVLHAAKLLKQPESTSGLINWGKAGQGKYMTVWVHEDGNPHTSHTFIVFSGIVGTQFFEAGGRSGLPTGFHPPRSLAGFVPRHWPGT
jgi:hypothetical protein